MVFEMSQVDLNNGQLEPFLLVNDVYKRYGDKCILDNIDLAVEKGEFCTVVGPSGCGKSTLLRLILGAEAPTSGSIFIDGRESGVPDTTRGIVFQRYSLYPNRTVMDNVLLGTRLSENRSKWTQRKAHTEAQELLARMRLSGHADKYPHELSGGMQQRVAIAQSLILKPAILLMDEPFGALDLDTREEMQLLLLELWEEFGMTIFFVTHDMDEAAYLGTRLLVLSQYYVDDRGHSEVINRGAKIVADHKLEKVVLGTDVKHSEEFARFIGQIRKEGFDPEHLQHATEFNLKHPHSFQTLTEAEKNR